MPAAAILAVVLALAGAVLCYAGARHQLLSPSAPRSALRWSGWALLAVSLVVMLSWFGPATAVFVWATLTMLIWSIVPLAAAWWRRPRSKAE